MNADEHQSMLSRTAIPVEKFKRFMQQNIDCGQLPSLKHDCCADGTVTDRQDFVCAVQRTNQSLGTAPPAFFSAID